MWWYIIGIIILIIIVLKIGQVKHICKLGFHESIDVTKNLHVRNFIEKTLDFYPDFFHQGNKSTYIRLIYQDIYPEDKYHMDVRAVSDSVCIKCDTCFLRVDKLQEKIVSLVMKEIKEIKKDRYKEKLAQDLYNEKCIKKGLTI